MCLGIVMKTALASNPFSFFFTYATILRMTELKATSRPELGRKASALRRAGFLPAVLYGEGVSSQSITIPNKEFEKALKEAGESTLVQLEVGGKQYNVLIHDIAYDPLRGTPTHADFYAVRMDKVIRTKVAIMYIGESPAVKNEGGILVKIHQELEIEALPQNLPHELRADLSHLVALETRLRVKDILLPTGVKVLADPEDILVLVETPRSEEELVALAEAPAAVVAEVKTEQEIKAETKAIKNETEKKEKEEKKEKK